MLELLQGIVLGLVQGITEFFPVSSSGHLILIPSFFKWEDQGLLVDTILHLGTLLALVWVFKNDICDAFVGTFQKKDEAARRFLAMVVVASVPGIFFGGLFGGWIEQSTRAPSFVVIGLIFWGLVLWVADRVASGRKRSTKHTNDLTWTQVLIVGFAQAIALFPGTSRSGITITGGLFSGLDRSTAVRFSFLVSIPTIAAAGAYGIYQLTQRGLDGSGFIILISGFVTAAIAGIWAITFLRSYVTKHSFTPFVIYRFLLAALVLFVL